jgi:sulfur relay (sulfurtransferase) complex TusBCD TusD component (DsrE family)
VRTYVLVESRSTFESPDVEGFLGLAARLGEEGHPVVLFLLQNAVLMAARGAAAPALDRLRGSPRVTVRADDLSLAARALDAGGLAAGIRVSGMPELVRLVTRPGALPIWH